MRVVNPPPTWSGRNTFGARRNAAEKIGAAVDAVADPSEAHFIVAHSHGGTAAMLALKDIERQSKIAGLVCLSTPFPVLHRGQFLLARPATARAILAVAFFTLVAFPALLALLVLLAADPGDDLQLPDFGLAVFGLGLVFGAALMLSPFAIVIARLWPFSRVLDGFVSAMRIAADTFISSHGLVPLREVPILVVRGSADEATAAITTVQFSRWLARHLRSAAIAAAVPVAFWIAYTNVPEGSVFGWHYDAIFVGLSTIFWPAVTAVFSTALYVLTRLLTAVALGWEMLFYAFTIDAVVESIPPGRSVATQTSELRQGTMAHSVYDDPVAAEAVVDWI